jgi:lipoate---protein ligase
MNYKTEKKVNGGKMVRVKIIADEYITDIQITGDFFLHPEETIMQIEKNLKTLHIDTPLEEIVDRINIVMNKNKAILIGLTVDDLAFIVREALNSPELK